MIKSVLEKNLIPVIADASALAQIFVVILFFENYLILFQEASLFQLTIDLGNIQLAPFIWFFIFIASGRFVWIASSFLIGFIKDKINSDFDSIKLDSKHHFNAFLLLILSFTYLINIENFNNQFVPFNVEEHWFLYYLFKSPLLLTIFASFIIIVFSDIRYSWEKE
ncbi:hypothetical protein GCM10011506_47870 [Marivirga lumbricoides]|uniref:Uncharacterized protein n=1 Tax=Marivirga lumbricoides TaxID=1046115 RepID=A0ABQ1N710_9BACT|nr:hypothetical protein GCM10011506_47870 [Marivirga lumbricoides]